MTSLELKQYIESNKLDTRLISLYGQSNLETQRERYLDLLNIFIGKYGDINDVWFYSVPGRTEISGNHTDHNNGKVLAASVNLDIIACAAKTDSQYIEIASVGFEPDMIDFSKLQSYKTRDYSSSSLIAGTCNGFLNRKYNIGSFVACTTSNVLKGSGLSSSAAFEVMIGNLLNHLYNDGKIESKELAIIAQYAENEYFGKPCGLMDQTACAVGGFVAIDFLNSSNPEIDKLNFNLEKEGYTLCIVDTGGNHADLNEDYASIPFEMKSVANFFGKKVLRETSLNEVLNNIPILREKCGDRAILRAIHFFDENERVTLQSAALKNEDLDTFFDLVSKSGNSSLALLQNIFTTKNVAEQGLSLALAISNVLLQNTKHAQRVHGGGFAGTIQVYVPNEKVSEYKAKMEEIFGTKSVHLLNIRSEGAIKL